MKMYSRAPTAVASGTWSELEMNFERESSRARVRVPRGEEVMSFDEEVNRFRTPGGERVSL